MEYGLYDWVIDATSQIDADPKLIKFMLIDIQQGRLRNNVFIWSTMCPDNLVGIIHFEGVAKLNLWIKQHPNWLSTYKNKLK